MSGKRVSDALGEERIERLMSQYRVPLSSPLVGQRQERHWKGAEQRFRAVRFSDMPAPKDRKYLVEGLVPEGYPMVVYGEGGSVKSTLALSLSISVAQGEREWMGRAVRQTPVLYVDFELEGEEQTRRAYKLARGVGLDKPPPSLFYLPTLGVPASEALSAALSECRSLGVGLVVIDSVGLALEGDSLTANDVIRFHKKRLDPFRSTGAALVLIDHQAKQLPGQRYQDRTAFGSVYKSLLARSIIQVQPKSGEDNTIKVEMRQTKHNFGPKIAPFGAKIDFYPQRTVVEMVELDERDLDGGTQNAAHKVRQALARGAAYPDDLAQATGLAAKTVKNVLTELKKAGKAMPTGNRRNQSEEIGLVSPSPSLNRDGDGDTASPGKARE